MKAAMQPLLLDLFCGAGGASAGYARAGFEVVGVDIKPQPRYPFVFRQGDALEALERLLHGREWGGYRLSDFAAIHASPPCQDYSSSRHVPRAIGVARQYPRLVVDVTTQLQASGHHWIIENVPGAERDMQHPVRLCGSMFGRALRRHRWFDSDLLLMSAGSCQHRPGEIGVYGHGALKTGTKRAAYQTSTGRTQWRMANARLAEAQTAMGIDWMGFAALTQAIPPIYTEWLGRQLLSALGCDVEVAE